jgi:hypothetical protein
MRLWRGLPAKTVYLFKEFCASQRRKMIKNQKEFHSPDHKPYWGVLARDLNTQAIHKPENFMSLLQAQYQKGGTEEIPVPLRSSTIPVLVRDRIPGKQKSNRLSKDIPL